MFATSEEFRLLNSIEVLQVQLLNLKVCNNLRILLHVILRPYRYNYFQKEELEKQVKDISSHGIIQPSQLSFSSAALLVKKKDELEGFVWVG